MVQWWGRHKRVKGLVGLSLGEHIALAHAVSDRDDVSLTYCVHTGRPQAGVAAAGDQQTQLSRLVDDAGLVGAPVNFVLSPADYNLFLVDAPPVPTEEMAAAVRWKIKDLLEFPVEDAIVDVFALPEGAARNRAGGMVYAVAAARARLEQRIATIRESGLELQTIDIPEMALRNIISRFADDQNGLAFLSLDASGGILNITRQGQLYLTRRINLAFGRDVTSHGDWDAVRARLVLEIQRSLDYFESQMGQDPVARVLVAPRDGDTAAVVDALSGALATPVVPLEIQRQLDAPDWVDDELKAACLTVIGGALRTGNGTV